MVTLNFDRTNRVITVASPDTVVDIQEIYDKSKDKEDDPGYIDEPIIMTATGKEVLTPSSSVAITAVMQNNWKVGFEARGGPDFIICRIDGGNMTDSSGTVGAWINPTAFVQVIYGSSSSATLVTGTGGLTAQDVRNAMKLAPSAGAFAAGSIDEKLEQIWQVETGTWRIIGTQMIFYEQDGTTEIFRRDLKDVSGDPSNTDVFEGVRV